MEAFTPEHFKKYASHLVLDTGEQWIVEDFQLEVFEPIFQGYTETWAIIPEANTKLLPVDALLPTPDGWTTMLDVQVGDELLNSQGDATTVVSTSPVEFDHDCYRITFSDGAFVVSSGVHRWRVEDAQDHYTSTVRSTRFLYTSSLARGLTLQKKGRGGSSSVARWRVRTGARAIGPEVSLPIEPYVLGVWLGDGDKRSPKVTSMDPEVWRELEASYEVSQRCPSDECNTASTRYVKGLVGELRANGLLGNKHIPDQYLIAPEEDRWALLQGLMDTDGCVSKAGQATYSGMNKRLVDDVRRLVWSLGMPCSIIETKAIFNGTDYGPSYLLTISCDQRHPITSLPRKQSRLKAHGNTCDHRRIVAIERVTSVPCKCVQVDVRDHLYLTSEAYIPTHNTTMMAGFALYHCDFTRSPWVPIAASSRDQAEIMAKQAYEIIRATPGMESKRKGDGGRFEIYEGYREIRHVTNRGRGIKVYAADTTTADGVIPTLALCDEGHRWPDLAVYRLWKGKLDKRHGQIVMISTAGEPGGDFERTRDNIRGKSKHKTVLGAHIKSVGNDIIMNEWMVERAADISNMEKVKEANPFSGVTVQSLTAHFEAETTDINDFKRLKCNLPARTVAAAITEAEWDEAYTADRIPEGAHIDVGCDVAWKLDTFAIQPLWQNREGESKPYNLLGTPIILEPPRDGSMISVDAVKQAFMDINSLNPIDTVVIDLERAEDIAQWLDDELGINIEERGPQKNAQAIEDYEAFMNGLRNGTLKHVGDPGLTRHVMNAIARALPGDKKRFDRPSQSRAKKKQEIRVIDCLSAAAMVNFYVKDPEEVQDLLVAWR